MQRDKQYEELKQLVLAKPNIIRLLKQGVKKYQHLMNLFIQFEEIANKWILEKTRLKQTKTKDQITKYINKAIRYCIVNNIITEEDLEQQIPKCIICGKYFGIPSSSTMKEDAFKIEKHCGDKYCHKKYVYIRTSESVKEKYGVDNISKLQEVQEKKERTFLRKYGVRHMQQSKEIREKTIETLQKKYGDGITNISQVRNIQEKKKETFKKHFGVDNIFKDTEYMKQIYKEKFGVTNPTLIKENLQKFIKTSNRYKETIIYGTKYIVMSDLEEELLYRIYNAIYNRKILPSDILKQIKVNEEIFYYYNTKERKDQAWLIDLKYNSLVVELKTSIVYPLNDDFNKSFIACLRNKDKFKKYLIICKTDTRSYCFQIDNKFKHAILYIPGYDQILEKTFVENLKKLKKQIEIDNTINLIIEKLPSKYNILDIIIDKINEERLAISI